MLTIQGYVLSQINTNQGLPYKVCPTRSALQGLPYRVFLLSMALQGSTFILPSSLFIVVMGVFTVVVLLFVVYNLTSSKLSLWPQGTAGKWLPSTSTSLMLQLLSTAGI